MIEYNKMNFHQFMKHSRWHTWREDFEEGFENISDGARTLFRGLALVLIRAAQFPFTPICKPIMALRTMKHIRERAKEATP